MSSSGLAKLVTAKSPAPTQRFTGLPKYNFVGGHNAPEGIPVPELTAAANSVLQREGHLLALYNLSHGPLGYQPLREFVAGKLAGRGISCTSDDILITSGSTQGLNLVFSLFLEQGSTIVVEEFTYSSVLNRLRNQEVETIGAPLTEHGIDIARLEELLEAQHKKDRPVRMVYTIPTIQNPTGTIMPMESRERLVALARQYNFVIFEDECYADLIWAADGVPSSIYSMAPDVTVHIGSFSKTLGPALRVGYAIAEWPILSRILALKNDAGSGAIDQMVVAEYFSHHFSNHLERLTGILDEKLKVMSEAIDAAFGSGVSYHVPPGGIFLWLKFPDHVDVRKLTAPALAAGVAFNPGPEWSANGEAARSWMRLCFALPSKEIIAEGIRKLSEICYAETGFPEVSGNRVRS